MVSSNLKSIMESLVKNLEVESRTYKFFDIADLGEEYTRLPFCLRILLESLVRKSGRETWAANCVQKVLRYRENEGAPLLFQPARVLLQDFTGVPALVELAAIRDVVAEKGGDVAAVDSACPADLVVDHSVQLDYSQVAAAARAKKRNERERQRRQLLSQQQQQPTIIVHSTFPPPPASTAVAPPAAAFYPSPQPPATFVYASATPAVYSVPQYFPVSQYQTYYATDHNATSLQGDDDAHEEGDDNIPTDNPGLPIQDEVCPFHQRLSYWADALRRNEELEFRRNEERFAFLKWADDAFSNVTVVPPGSGTMHQINLEYLARVVVVSKEANATLFPDTLVGTDSHTTMVNGLGILGWGVSTMDAEAVMFGHPVSMPVPKVVGCRIIGSLPPYATSTEIVLLVTKRLRQSPESVSGCFVEFFGPGVLELSVSDRAAIANMCPEYGALVGFFPTDEETLRYLDKTGRDAHQMKCIKEYLNSAGMIRKCDDEDPDYSAVVEVDLAAVSPCMSGPKCARDKAAVGEVAANFRAALNRPEEYGGFGIAVERSRDSVSVNVDGRLNAVAHGSVLLAAIASCSNTSNPTVMLAAGLLAKRAIEAGLSVPNFVRTSLAPGSGVVTSYLQESGVMPYLYMLGFEVVGYGCSACVDNSRPWRVLPALRSAVAQGNLVCCGILSGNRNFEGRLQMDLKANYLASPLLVIAYALAGRVDIDFEREPLGYEAKEGKPVFLADVWPSRAEVREVELRFVVPAIFRQVFARVSYGNKHWSALKPPSEGEAFFHWDDNSTFIQQPLYVLQQADAINSGPQKSLLGMRCLLKLGDDVPADHISPAGSIVRHSPAADYLSSLGLAPRDFGSYGAHRCNWRVMSRGAFAHPRLKNVLSDKCGPFTTHFPSEVRTSVHEAARRYKREGVNLFVLAGEKFGRGGAARDWAAKGPFVLGVRAVLALSFDDAFRSSLVKAGILPVIIDATTYEILTGSEKVDVMLPEDKDSDEVTLRLDDGGFDLSARNALANEYEVSLFRRGGIIKDLLAKALREVEG